MTIPRYSKQLSCTLRTANCQSVQAAECVPAYMDSKTRTHLSRSRWRESLCRRDGRGHKSLRLSHQASQAEETHRCCLTPSHDVAIARSWMCGACELLCGVWRCKYLEGLFSTGFVSGLKKLTLRFVQSSTVSCYSTCFVFGVPACWFVMVRTYLSARLHTLAGLFVYLLYVLMYHVPGMHLP